MLTKRKSKHPERTTRAATKHKKSIKTVKLPKTRTLAQLKRSADVAWSLYIRYRDSTFINNQYFPRCITCGSRVTVKTAQCGHFQSRVFSSTRYDPINTNVQCLPCNVFGHGEQYKYARALDALHGVGTAEKLYQQARQFHKLTRLELQSIINFAEQEVRNYRKLESSDSD